MTGSAKGSSFSYYSLKRPACTSSKAVEPPKISGNVWRLLGTECDDEYFNKGTRETGNLQHTVSSQVSELSPGGKYSTRANAQML